MEGSVYQCAGIVDARARSGVNRKEAGSMPQATTMRAALALRLQQGPDIREVLAAGAKAPLGNQGGQQSAAEREESRRLGRHHTRPGRGQSTDRINLIVA